MSNVFVAEAKPEAKKGEWKPERKIWSLRDRFVGIAHFGSGNPEGDYWRVRVMWSEKLGLQLDHIFKSREAAEKAKKTIMEAGRINTELWSPTFYPYPGWEIAQSVD